MQQQRGRDTRAARHASQHNRRHKGTKRTRRGRLESLVGIDRSAARVRTEGRLALFILYIFSNVIR